MKKRGRESEEPSGGNNLGQLDASGTYVRCREKQNKEATELHSQSKELSAINETLTEENDCPLQQLRLLVSEDMPQNIDSGTATNGWNCQDVITAPQHSLMDISGPAGLISMAEETLARFLEKATANALDWVPMPGMKSDPDSTGIFTISQSCNGVAARAFGVVNLDSTKIVEILKDRACWFQDCRHTEICTTIQTTTGGIIELMYTQTYAPTTLAQARDFWTLRYTKKLDNGRLAVCERSLLGSVDGPDVRKSLQFARAEMFPSGYMIRPSMGGTTIIYIVDHINFAAWDLQDVLRPIYESAEVVAQRMTIAALRYVRQLAREATGDEAYEPGRQPAILRTYSQKLSRGFNDAISGFFDDGWLQLSYDANQDVIVTVKSTTTGTSSSSHQLIGGILCAKTTMLLEIPSPAVLVRFLREHRSEWSDFSVDSYCAASMKASCGPHLGMRPTSFRGRQIMMPLGHTIEHEQMLELIRLESLSVRKQDEFKSMDVHLLQMCSGMDENSVGAYSELVFSAIDNMLPDDFCLLPSGFRIIPLIVKSGGTQNLSTHKAQGPSSSHSLFPPNGEGNATSAYTGRAILTMAFQFPIGGNLQDYVASMAFQYVQGVMSSVKRLADAITSPRSIPDFLSSNISVTPEAHTLAQWTWQSYCSLVGGPLLQGDLLGRGSTLKNLWNHKETILCCSLEVQPRFLFVNQAGLNMLETDHEDLRYITLNKIMSELEMKTLISHFPQLIHRGFFWLPSGICTSTKRHHASYDYILAWKVLAVDNVTIHCFAMSFVNWSFV